MPAPEKIITIDVDIVHQTEKAYLIDNGSKEAWIPKSIAEYDETDGTMQMPEKFAMEKELI